MTKAAAAYGLTNLTQLLTTTALQKAVLAVSLGACSHAAPRMRRGAVAHVCVCVCVLKSTRNPLRKDSVCDAAKRVCVCVCVWCVCVCVCVCAPVRCAAQPRFWSV